MISYQITDTPTALKLISNGIVRMLEKNHIREISVVKNSTIQIDLGEDRRIFLPFSNITVPVLNDVAALVEELNNYVNSFQQYQYSHIIQLLEQIQFNAGNGGGNPQDYVWFSYIYHKTPKVVDERNPNVIYRGFIANANDRVVDPLFCIERITSIEPGVTVREWAEGDITNFNLIWNERETYNYQ
ncbi:MAG: hypothetical protein RJA07_483 [Bacteroidota bacterium]|jgi:hypothetical protein